MKDISILPDGYRDDVQKKARFNTLFKRFKAQKKDRYVQFDGYCLSLNHQRASAGLRWFHCGKYLVEVVVTMESGPHQNIAPWVLFSKYEDAILHMTLIEEKAVEMLRKNRLKEKEIKSCTGI